MHEEGQDKERGSEAGKDGSCFTHDAASILGFIHMCLANMKRTYDEYQAIGLEDARRNARYTEKVLSDAQVHSNNVNQIAVQALQNAVETANMVGKQAVRHGDIAINEQWHVAEQDAFATILAAKVAEKLDSTAKQ